MYTTISKYIRFVWAGLWLTHLFNLVGILVSNIIRKIKRPNFGEFLEINVDFFIQVKLLYHMDLILAVKNAPMTNSKNMVKRLALMMSSDAYW